MKIHLLLQKDSKGFAFGGVQGQGPWPHDPIGLRRMFPSRGRSRMQDPLEAGAIVAAADPEPVIMDDFQTMPNGIRYRDDVVGTGAEPVQGQTVIVHYTGWLDDDGKPGAKFDSSRDRGSPFRFTLGVQQVISGWDIGVASMRVGGRRTLLLPPEHGYGTRGAGRAIPPNATLIFDVELLDLA